MKMMKHSFKAMRQPSRRNEAGQSILFVVLALGIFLLGALCFAFDLSNIWFHRQAAQTAADAACAAGAMDILVDAQGGASREPRVHAGNCLYMLYEFDRQCLLVRRKEWL